MTAKSDPSPILYASISRGPTLLAHLLPADSPDLSSLAAICLNAAPQFHQLYTHSTNSRLYAFLIAPPLVFFAIANDSLGRSSLLLFLHRLRDDSSSRIAACGPFQHLCLQEELLPVIRRLAVGSEEEDSIREEGIGEECEISVMGNNDDVDVDVSLGLGGRKTVERIWWGQVRMVVIIDVVVCSVLFGVWLCVCKGFHCIRG